MEKVSRRKFGRERAAQVRQIILDYGRLHPGAKVNDIIQYLNAQGVEHPNGPEWNIPRFNAFWNFYLGKNYLGANCKVTPPQKQTPVETKVEQIYTDSPVAAKAAPTGDRLDLVTIIMASDRDPMTKERLISTLFDKG